MIVFKEVMKLPSIKKALRVDPRGYITESIYAFISGPMKIAMVTDISGAYANGNNLRKAFADCIEREHLKNSVYVTLRGNDVFLVKKGFV